MNPTPTPETNLNPSPSRARARSLAFCRALALSPTQGADRAVLRYTLPLAEIASDFHDRVKSISNGFASLDYEQAGYQPNPYP